MIPPRPEAIPTTDRSLAGRVVRLHLSCSAELPMGSHLRVVVCENSGNQQQPEQVLAVSVPMVTTPEDYPVWKTQRPVVVVLHRHAATKKAVQRFYYRYFAAAPVVSAASGVPEPTDGQCVVLPSAAAVATSDAPNTPVVIEWEQGGARMPKKLPANGDGEDKVEYQNLPYRTLDIHVASARVAEAVQDVWNRSEDATFQPFLIREAIHEEKRRKLFISSPGDSMIVDIAQDVSMDQDDEDEPACGNKPTSGQATPPAFSKSSRIYFVCFHLPIVVVQNNQGEWQASWSESILARTEGSQILSTYSAYWLGTVTTHPPLQTEADRETVRELLKKMNCIPIFLDPAMRQSHYYGFCKQVLWPAFHNIDMLDLSTCGWLSDPNKVASDWDQSRLDDWWNAYYVVNKEFLNHMSSLIRAGDIIWIHDYHLSLLPEMLTRFEMERYNMKLSRTVFFLHIPFPTSQIFRELECGEKILKGMLHADVVGFHAFDHARHFLNAAKRILGLNYESLSGGLIGVDYQGRTVLVSMSNVSIEPRMMDAALKLPSVARGVEQLKQKHQGLIVIGGVDIGQRLSGTSLKLLAYERLLQDCPNYQQNVVMVERLVLPGSRRADEELTVREVRSLVQRIKERFGESVIDYQELIGTSLPMDQRLALWKATDIMMCTPIREALNHWPMEFIYAHKDDTPGVVITSEFSAVCSILNGALRVNPYDIQATKTTIDKALSMSTAEREGRRYRDIDFVSHSQSDKWVKNVLRDLRDATAARNPSGGSESNSQMSTPYATPNVSRKLQENTTSGFLVRESNQAFGHLHVKDLAKAYACTKRRVIILDFNGTIVLKEPPGKYLKREILGTSGNKPPPEVIDALGKLCNDPKNTVYVVSGDSSENVVNALGHLPSLGLAVSNGACFSPPVYNSYERSRWLTFDLGVDWDAVKKVALPVLSKYTARSNGSFVKLTSFSIGWSYYSCDPEWGTLQASHLVMELEKELRYFDVRFVTLKGIVEIVPRMLDKGLIVRKVLHDIAAARNQEGTGVDFVLCMGDDISDEKMFSSVYTFAAELDDTKSSSGVPRVFDEDGMLDDGHGHDGDDDHENHDANAMDTTTSAVVMPDPAYIFTVAVGKKVTQANTYVNDAQEVADAVYFLANGELPQSQNTGWGDGETSRMFD